MKAKVKQGIIDLLNEPWWLKLSLWFALFILVPVVGNIIWIILA